MGYFSFICTETDKKTTMADNYLERQREQYESRKAAWEHAKRFGKKKPLKKTGNEGKNAGKRL